MIESELRETVKALREAGYSIKDLAFYARLSENTIRDFLIERVPTKKTSLKALREMVKYIYRMDETIEN